MGTMRCHARIRIRDPDDFSVAQPIGVATISLMSLEPIAAAGDLATGTLLARAVEPEAGEATASAGTGACLNCGCPLTTRYCGECGQSAHVHTTLGSLAHDLVHGLFHFEGKIARTLPMLLRRPGELTRRYIAGERAKFVSPLALFLFAAFLMFAMFESVGGPFHPRATVIRNGQPLSPEQVTRFYADARAREANLGRQLAALAPGHDPEAARLRSAIADAKGEADGLALAASIDSGHVDTSGLAKYPPVTGFEGLDRRIREATANPELLLLKLQSNAHKFTWVLIPLSVPFLWLVFAWRREYRLYDHTVFIVYALSAVMLLMTAMALLSATGLSVEWALFLIPVHQYLQLRGAYRISRWGAIWRAAWLTVSANVVLSLFAILLLASGLIG